MGMKPDEFRIEILPDGTFKVETDAVSSANHVNAEGFMKSLFADLGIAPRVKHKHGKHAHGHSHGHGHGEGHGNHVHQ